MHPLKKLILVSLGKETCFERTPTATDWAKLYHSAKSQALLGVLYDGVMRLPEGQRPPERIMGQWTKDADRIQATHALHLQRVDDLEHILSELDLHGCILKGTSLARLYPAPDRRMCGDIDLWVAGSRRHTVDTISTRYHVHSVLYQECKALIFRDAMVEVHFHPTKMYNPFHNARLQRYLERMSPIRNDVTLTEPGAEFNAVFCMAHMLRHVLEGGLGLRQMMDYYYVLMELPAEAHERTMRMLRRLGMRRFAGAVMYVMEKCFALESEYLLCPADHRHGHRLLQEILRYGNFGVLDARNHSSHRESRWARFRRKNKRVFSLLREYPGEVIWSPFARVAQYIMRKVGGYL